MKTGKKWLAVAVAVCMAAVVFGGCSMVSVNEGRDKTQVVAVVNGVEIYKNSYNQQKDSILSQYGMTDADVEASDDPELYKQSIIDALVEQELAYQYAEEQGMVDLSEEHIEELTTEENKMLRTFYDAYLEQGKTDGVEDSEAFALEKYSEYLKAAGYTDVETAVMLTIRNQAINDVYAQVTEDVDYTEGDAREYYDMQVDMQESFVMEDPSNYEMYSAFGTAYVNPAGSRYVKNLLISIPDEAQTEISSLRSAGQDEEADAMLEAELAKILPDAEAALERAEAGEDFAALIEELGSDNGMTVDPGMTWGYLVIDGGTDYVESFQEASMALEKEGDISGLVPSDYGYHIIQYFKDGAGPIPFEMVKDDIISTQGGNEEATAYTDFISGLKEDAEIKTYVNRV